MPIEVMLFTKKDCPNCPHAKKILAELAHEMGRDIELKEYDLDREEDFLTALQHQVRSTPAVVVGGTLVAAGRQFAKEEVLRAIIENRRSARGPEV